jgi:hypothetical protein
MTTDEVDEAVVWVVVQWGGHTCRVHNLEEEPLICPHPLFELAFSYEGLPVHMREWEPLITFLTRHDGLSFGWLV